MEADFQVDRKMVDSMIDRIVRDLHPQRIILFGSYAYGNATPDSDVDLLIIMETAMRPVERNRVVSRLLSPRKLPVDIVVKTPQEIEKSQRRVDPFLHEILNKGKVVYARPG
jgi:predicted nucleotidyltransferase